MPALGELRGVGREARVAHGVVVVNPNELDRTCRGARPRAAAGDPDVVAYDDGWPARFAEHRDRIIGGPR